MPELAAEIRASVRMGEVKLEELNELLVSQFGQKLELASEVPCDRSALVGVGHQDLPADHCILVKNGAIECDTFAGDPRHPGDGNWTVLQVWKFVDASARGTA